MSDETTQRVCAHCGEPTDAGHHVGGYCYCGDRINQWLPIEAEPSPAPPAERVIEVAPQEEIPRPPLTDEYVQQELEKCGEPTCYICRLSRDLLETRSALTAAREELDKSKFHCTFLHGDNEGQIAHYRDQLITVRVERDRARDALRVAEDTLRTIIHETSTMDHPAWQSANRYFLALKPVSDRQPEGETK